MGGERAHPPMASRKNQKEEARERRLAEERAVALKARKTRRLRMIGVTVAAAIIVVVVLVIISSSGGGSSSIAKVGSHKATSTTAAIDKLLQGIPQSGTTLGKASAPVTVTEYGDLECPICRDFALGAENTLISNDVRSGKVKLVYKSFPTATGNGPDPSVFPVQQAAAYAAGAQDLAWNYIETFYREQGTEDTAYVNTSYLTNLAKQVTGLDVAKWASDRFNPTYTAEVTKQEQTATGLGVDATPSFVVSGPKSQTKAQSGDFSYSQIESMIKSVQ